MLSNKIITTRNHTPQLWFAPDEAPQGLITLRELEKRAWQRESGEFDARETEKGIRARMNNSFEFWMWCEF